MHEELCFLKPMHGTTTGKDIFDTFTKHFEEREIDMKKIFSVTTDGAPAMIGHHLGFVNLSHSEVLPVNITKMLFSTFFYLTFRLAIDTRLHQKTAIQGKSSP